MAVQNHIRPRFLGENVNFMIIFKNGELTIEELIPSDTNNMFILIGKSEIQKYIPDRFESIEAMHGVIMWLISNYQEKDPIRLTYKICFEKKLIGWISYGPLPFDETKKEVAYVIDPKYWGRGYATEGVRGFIKWLKERDLNGKLYAEIDVENIGSKKVIERNKFEEIKEFEDKETKRRKKLYFMR